MNGDQQELIKGTAEKKKRAPPKRRYIFEGLAWAVFGKKWQQVKGYDLGRLRKAEKELRTCKGVDDADPATVKEIERRAVRWRQLNARTPKYMGKLDNPVLLAGDWRLCEFKPTIQPGQPSRKEQAERDARLRRRHEAAWSWWRKKDSAETLEAAKRYPPAATPDEVMLAEFESANRPGFKP